jgi:hypothetical protein
MFAITCLFFLFCVSNVSYTVGEELSEYFNTSQSIYGGTGQIVLPSTKVISRGKYALSIHGFDINAVYGIYEKCELGVFFNLKTLSLISIRNIREKMQEFYIHFKYQIFKMQEFPLEISCGIHGLGPNVYLVVLRKIKNFYPYIGVSFKQDTNLYVKSFFSISTIRGMSMFILDYKSDDETLHLGWKFLLSPKIKFDVGFVRINEIKNINQLKDIFFNNFIFGLSYSE